MKELLEPIRGFRDYVPPESDAITWICDNFKEVARLFGYREVKTPTVENFKLFALKSGEEIRNSMYVFKDKGDREVALRPEVTPSVIRVYLKELRSWPKPLRLFYVANVFRYDEPQYGRYREFTQAGVEILGGDGTHYDSELIELLEEFYHRIGLARRVYKVNNVAIFKKIAKIARFTDEETERMLHLLDKGMFQNVAGMFESKGFPKYSELVMFLANAYKEGYNIDGVIAKLSELRVYDELREDIELLAKYIDMVKGIGANVVVDPGFARGIAYYTSIIFEVQVPGMTISIAGGGRYDNLTTVYGGEELSSTGFAIGVERTLLALQNLGIDLEKLLHRPSTLFLLLDESIRRNSNLNTLLKQLRGRGVVVQLEVSPPAKMSRWLEYASKTGFDYVVIIGRKEAEKGMAVVRDLKRWSQTEVDLNHLVEVLGHETR
ncbi:MAG: histidine--tRNA ligase [Ignisphaera sp.]